MKDQSAKEKRCPTCHHIFYIKNYIHKQIYCSRKCYAAARRKDRLRKICQICGKAFEIHVCHRHGKGMFCSPGCKNRARRKVKWPTKEALEHLLGRMPLSGVAKMYDVTDNAVRYWAKVYGVSIAECREGLRIRRKLAVRLGKARRAAAEKKKRRGDAQSRKKTVGEHIGS